LAPSKASALKWGFKKSRTRLMEGTSRLQDNVERATMDLETDLANNLVAKMLEFPWTSARSSYFSGWCLDVWISEW
jgi:hypothetical protein